YFIDEQTFVFRIVWDYNGNDIRNARISLMRDASSSLHASTFTIAFRPTRGSDESDEQARILYVIDGRWDPVGRGDVSFTGELRIRADGMATCVIRSERQWVYLPPDGFNYLRRLPLPTPRAEMHAFEVLFSPAGSDRINAGTERAVLDWYDRLDAELRRNVANGSIQVVLHGYASTTGDEPHNRVLARRRAERVQTILRDQLGPNARIEVVAHGERGVNTPDNTESPPNRKVRVEIRRYVQP
ncbi:MAG: OmpA family protein, partial [Gemmatimonadaceae bacterium]